MGYFRRKLDRGRAAREARELAAGALEPGDWPLLDEQAPSPMPHSYLRFAVDVPHGESGRKVGLFHATTLIDGDGLDPAVRAELEGVLEHFDAHLRAPELDEPEAIFWFKADRRELVARVWNLAWILREEGFEVRYRTTRQPGRIVYEDDDQIAALPWRSTPDP